jgi:hypothetical protein
VRGVALWTERLAAALPPGTRAGFLWQPRPDAVALDLALQAAGLVSVPLAHPSQDELQRRGVAAWVGPPMGSLPAIDLPPWPETDPPQPPSPIPFSRPTGGAVTVDPDGSVREWPHAALGELAERVDSRIGTLEEGREILREIVIAGRSLEETAERAVIAWATIQGAALLLAPTQEERAATAAWVRPTVFHGTAAEAAALRRMDRPRRFRLRRSAIPFGRLHTLLVTGPDELPAAEAEAWRARGTAVVRLTVL